MSAFKLGQIMSGHVMSCQVLLKLDRIYECPRNIEMCSVLCDVM